MATIAAPMIHDELDSVITALCARFPLRTRHEIVIIVTGVYEQLAASATITAHLIPLTLNRSRRLLSSTQATDDSGRDASTERNLHIDELESGLLGA